MAGGLPSAGIDSIAHCGTMIEPNNNVVTDMHENTFLFNYPPDVQVSQPIQHCLATPEMHMNHATIKSQFIPSKEEMNVKDLQKRAAHNKIEKRRRSFINDKISELQSLLPEDNRTSCYNKGSILKESVDYIKKLQSDFAVIKQLKEKISEIDLESKQMAKRLEMLEMRTSSDVVNTKSPDNVQNISTTLEDSTNMRFDSGMIECLPKVLPTMSQSVDLDDIFDTLASTFKDN